MIIEVAANLDFISHLRFKGPQRFGGLICRVFSATWEREKLP